MNVICSEESLSFFTEKKKIEKDEAVRKERASTGSQSLLC